PTSSTTLRPGVLANNTPNQLQTALGLNAPPQLVLARGCYRVGDGGGGVFYWDTGTGLENEDDGGTYIVPEGNVGSEGDGLRRIWVGQMNIRWFGAPAVYDAQLSTHYPIQLAINSAIAQKGLGISTVCPVYFPPGSYWLSTTVDAQGINLIGDNAIVSPSGGT